MFYNSWQLSFCTVNRRDTQHQLNTTLQARNQRGGICPPPEIFKKLSNNKVEILYSNHFKEKPYWNFSLSYLSPYKIYLEIDHLIKNFVNDWYSTINMLELGDRLNCW